MGSFPCAQDDIFLSSVILSKEKDPIDLLEKFSRPFRAGIFHSCLHQYSKKLESMRCWLLSLESLSRRFFFSALSLSRSAQ